MCEVLPFQAHAAFPDTSYGAASFLAENHMNQFDVLAIIVICIAAVLIADRVARVASRRCRVENIKNAGWPPYYLDADGDKHAEGYDDNDVELFMSGVHPMQLAATAVAQTARAEQHPATTEGAS